AAGVAACGLAAGGIFGALAIGKMHDYDDRAPRSGVVQDDARQRALSDDGKRDAVIADVALIVGVAAAAASFYWFKTEGRSDGRFEVRPVAAGIGVSGRF
ncbi:MAG TPA: hypothetical protein VGJ32_11155, partial [Solirubrobacteraceae bacterium]